MTGTDDYLRAILAREATPPSLSAAENYAVKRLAPIIDRWSNGYLSALTLSGSRAKGTANVSGTDLDLFISLSDTTPENLEGIYFSLVKALRAENLDPRLQNVSVGLDIGSKVDLIPARRQSTFGSDHSLFRRKNATWTKTNIDTHIAVIAGSGRRDEIRLLKLWRDQKGFELPSLLIELMVIDALRGAPVLQGLSSNVVACMTYIRDHIQSSRVVDPANTNNVISDDLSAAEKQDVANAAVAALNGSWREMVS